MSAPEAAWQPTIAPWKNELRECGPRLSDGTRSARWAKKIARARPFTSYPYASVDLPAHEGEQPALICARQTFTVAIDVDDERAYSAAGLPFGRDDASTTRGDGYHVVLDYRGIPDDLWPAQGPIPGGDIKSAGFVPLPGCEHWTGDRYEPVKPGAIIIHAVTDEQAQMIKAVRDGYHRKAGGAGGTGGGKDGRLAGRVYGWVLRGLSKEECYQRWVPAKAEIGEDAAWPWEYDDFDRHWRGAARKFEAMTEGMAVSDMAGDDAQADDRGTVTERPVIQVTDKLAAMIAEGKKVLVTANDPPDTFRTQGRLTRIGQDDDGWPVIRPYGYAGLLGCLADKADWVKVYADGSRRDVSPPRDMTHNLLEMADSLAEVPVVEQIATMPFFAPDGTLVTTPGYSEAARVWYEPAPGVVIPAVPERPSAAELAQAVSLLTTELLIDFPFEGPADRSHALALLLLPFIRPMIKGPTPLHLVDAPTPGSGKGLLTKACMLVSHGSLPPARSLPSSDENETRKLLSSIFMAGYQTTWFDNVRGSVHSGVLSQAIAEPVWGDRLLGANRNIVARVRCTWVMSGNNVQLSGEMARRAVRSRLDPAVVESDAFIAEHPWRRRGFRHRYLLEWAQENLGDLAHAALVIIRSWQAAGSRQWSGEPLGTFEAWSRTMGGIIEHAGGSGFLANLESAYDEMDDERDSLHAFIEMWAESHGDSQVTNAQLMALSALCDGDVLGVSGLAGKGASTKAGQKLTSLRGKVISGYVIRKTSRNWQLLPHRKAGQ